jgi:hypothetical protein
LHITTQRVDVREQVVREKDRLSVLEMSPPRHDSPLMDPRLRDQRILYVGDAGGGVPSVIAKVHPEERRYLIVPRSSRSQSAAQTRPDPFDQSPFECRVTVLVRRNRSELARLDLRAQPGQSVEQCR